MAVRRRPVRPNDIWKCVDVLASHPILGPRYADILADLPKVMLSLLGREAFACTVYEEVGPPCRILGGAVATFVHESFLREIKTPPSFWGVPEIVRRERKGQSPILSDREVRHSNSNDGLSMFVWHTGVLEEDWERMEVATLLLSSFIENFRGYRLREFLQQAETWRHFCVMRQAGGCLIRPIDGQYADYHETIEADVARIPLTAGITRELARGATIGSLIGALFNYTPPRFGLSRAHQRLVLAALEGHTDEELSENLGVSLFAVKKAWHEISLRLAPHLPTPPAETPQDGHGHPRGKQKRHHLIAYLREHPEELRPFERQHGTVA